MSDTYDYLRQFLPPHPEYDGTQRNHFYPISEEEIIEAENKFGIEFPLQLREFYRQIGAGFLDTPHNAPKGYRASDVNYIMPPKVVAYFYQGIIEHQKEPKEEALNYDDFWLALSALEDFVPGDLPFFEIGESSSFMIMKLNSDNPNAVWYMGYEKIEDSFEEFIRKLYYEGPSYYTKNW